MCPRDWQWPARGSAPTDDRPCWPSPPAVLMGGADRHTRAVRGRLGRQRGARCAHFPSTCQSAHTGSPLRSTNNTTPAGIGAESFLPVSFPGPSFTRSSKALRSHRGSGPLAQEPQLITQESFFFFFLGESANAVSHHHKLRNPVSHTWGNRRGQPRPGKNHLGAHGVSPAAKYLTHEP